MATQATGANATLIMSPKESTYGTTPADTTSSVALPFVSNSLKAEQKVIKPNTITSSRQTKMPTLGNKSAGGSVVVPLGLASIGYWLRMAMAAPTTSGGPTYTHVFKAASTVDSWCLEKGFTDLDTDEFELFKGCKVNKLSFSFDQSSDNPLTATADVIAATSAWSTSSIDSSPTALSDTTLAIGDLALTEGGSSIATVQSLTMEYSNNLDESIFCIGGGGVRGGLPVGLVSVSGKIKAMFDGMTLLNKAINGTETAIVATLTNGSYSLALDVGECKYSRMSPVVETTGGIWVELDYEGYYDNDADASILKATLINATATYPS